MAIQTKLPTHVGPVSAEVIKADMQSDIKLLETEINKFGDAPRVLGAATAGSATTLADANANLDVNALAGGTLIVGRAGNIVRVATIISNTATTFTVATGAAMQAGDTYTAIADANAGINAANQAIASLDDKTHQSLTKGVSAGGTITLTPAENGYGHYVFTGTLAANVTVVFDATPHKFSVSNQTSGAGTLTIKQTTYGNTVTLDKGERVGLIAGGGIFREDDRVLSSGNIISLRDKAALHWSGARTGAIKLGLGIGFNNTMMKAHISIYDYNHKRNIDVIVGGYASVPTSSWLRTSCTVDGVAPPDDMNVRLGFDGTQCVILIGDDTSTWVIGSAVVTKAELLWLGRNKTANAEWTIGFVTNSATYAHTIKVPRADVYAARAWITPTYVNGWMHGSFGGLFQTIQYIKHGKHVTIRGITTGGSNTTNTTIFTLPAGYRPASQIITSQQASQGTARVDILANGNVNHMGIEVHSGNATTYLYINETFVVEQ